PLLHPGSLARVGAVVAQDRQLLFRARLRVGAAAAAPQLVGDRVMRDLEEPRPDGAARRVEARRVSPDSEQDVLRDLLGRGPVERARRHAEDDRPVARIERSDRVLAAVGERADQLLVRDFPARVSLGHGKRVSPHSYSTRTFSFIEPCPEPQKLWQMTVKVPASGGAITTSAVLPGSRSLSIFNARWKKPCVTSWLVTSRRTVSPRLTVISGGTNSKRFAVMAIVRGASGSSVCGRAPAAASAEAMTKARTRNRFMTGLLLSGAAGCPRFPRTRAGSARPPGPRARNRASRSLRRRGVPGS